MTEKSHHHGKNLARIMRILDVKQDTLANALGEDWNQQKVSLLISKEKIEGKVLEDVAKALKIPAEAIKFFDEEMAVNIVANTINNHDQSAVINYQPTFNPVDKIIELYERQLKEKDAEIKRLRAKKK